MFDHWPIEPTSPPTPPRRRTLRDLAYGIAISLVVGIVLTYAYRRRTLRMVKDMAETVILALVLFLAINAVSQRIRVDSVSMQPTLFAGDFVLVNRLAYIFGNPSRGEVIVFKYPPDPTQIPYIKRIVGLPGDRVHISDGNIYINGQLLLEPYLKVVTSRGGDWTVPADSLFVMGDNRNNSSDSRSWGFVPMGNIIGKAEFIYLPIQHWAWLSFPSAVAADPGSALSPPSPIPPTPTRDAAAYPTPAEILPETDPLQGAYPSPNP